MKKIVLFAILIPIFINAQSFRKGAFLISASEGSVQAHYHTANLSSSIANDVNIGSSALSNEYMHGERDPLIFEYGLTNRIGIGLSLGGDVWQLNAQKYYGISDAATDDVVNLKTHEITIDVNYHLLVRRKIDWAIYSSVGPLAVGFNEKFNDREQNYFADGFIFRYGTTLRYYIFKRFAIMGMLSHYDSKSSPVKADKNNLSDDYLTHIDGMALEFGFSFRFGQYAWDKLDLPFHKK